MDNTKSKNRDLKNKISKTIVSVVMMVYFAICGGMIGTLLGLVLPRDASKGQKIVAVIVLLVAFYVAIFVHLCIHETGHMICGLLSGYEFISIRFGSIIIYKTEGKTKIGKYTLAGTGGQCIMMPPQISIEEIPVALYNWGGVIANVIFSLIFGVLYIVPGMNSYVKIFSAVMVLIGLFMILTNGIPVGFMGNDGHNAISLKKDVKAKKAFVISFNMVGKMQLGMSPKDFPAEWFEWSYEPGDSALAASHGMQRLSWLIIKRKFEEAYELGKYIDENVQDLGLTSQMAVKLETFFAMLMTVTDEEKIKSEYKKLQKEFTALRQLPSTQRTLYVYQMLIEKDAKEAEKTKKMFDTIAKKYPYPLEIEVEKELLELVEEKQ